VLKQPQYQPLPVAKQVITIYAATNGYLDNVAVEQVRDYETELYKFLDTRRAQLLSQLAEKRELNDQIKADLNQTLKEFGDQFAAARKAAA
jgi:F-type H+-transporting ATPase subunit alpha